MQLDGTDRRRDEMDRPEIVCGWPLVVPRHAAVQVPSTRDAS
jgi:hypothetical protein